MLHLADRSTRSGPRSGLSRGMGDVRPATSVAVAPGKLPPGPVAVQAAARGCARDRWGPSFPLGVPGSLAFDPWPQWLLKPCLMMISRF